MWCKQISWILFMVALTSCSKLPDGIRHIQAHPVDDNDAEAIKLCQQILGLPYPENHSRVAILFDEPSEEQLNELLEQIRPKAGSGTIRYLLDVCEQSYDSEQFVRTGWRHGIDSTRAMSVLRVLEPVDILLQCFVHRASETTNATFKMQLLVELCQLFPRHVTLPILAESLDDDDVCYPRVARSLLDESSLIYRPKNRVCDSILECMVQDLWVPGGREQKWMDAQPYERRRELFISWWRDNSDRLLASPEALDKRAVGSFMRHGIPESATREQRAVYRKKQEDTFREWLNLPDELASPPMSEAEYEDMSRRFAEWQEKYKDTPLEQIPSPDFGDIGE